jgi:hypothetical protein
MSKRLLVALVLGIVVGVVGLAGFRFATVHAPEPVHFHANFAVVVDGQRVDFSGDQFMEEIGACKAGHQMSPTERVHLHDNNQDVVHVHHDGVTWGHFFANLRGGLGDDYLRLPDGRLLVPGDGKTLKFILNGQGEYSVYNQPIRSTDRLLVSFGSETEREVVERQFPLVADNAAEYNQKPDPASCSGAAHEHGLWERVRHAFVG